MAGTKPLAFGAATGAAAQFVGQMARQNIDFIGKNWYGEGLVLGAGAFLLRKRPVFAHALAGAAGYAITQAYRARGTTGAPGSQVGALQEPGTVFGT